MDRTQWSMWVAAPREGPLVRGRRIAFKKGPALLERYQWRNGVVQQTNKEVENPSFHIVYHNSTPGLPHSHQPRMVTRLHPSPTLIAERGTASVARLAAPLGE